MNPREAINARDTFFSQSMFHRQEDKICSQCKQPVIKAKDMTLAHTYTDRITKEIWCAACAVSFIRELVS